MGTLKKNFSVRMEVACSPRKKMAMMGRMDWGAGGGETGHLPWQAHSTRQLMVTNSSYPEV